MLKGSDVINPKKIMLKLNPDQIFTLISIKPKKSLQPMKIYSSFVLLSSIILLPFIASSQNIVVVSQKSDPSTMYRQAHELLSEGQVASAISLFDQVIAVFESEGREKELSENFLGIALSFALNGNYEESIRYHKKALKAHHKYRPTESDDEIVMNLGFTYQLAGKEKKAKRYLHRS